MWKKLSSEAKYLFPIFIGYSLYKLYEYYTKGEENAERSLLVEVPYKVEEIRGDKDIRRLEEKKQYEEQIENLIKVVHSRIDEEVIELECRKPQCSGGDVSDEAVLKIVQPGEDGRKFVDEPKKWPHCVQGRLIAVFHYIQYRKLIGSGTMIGPQLVLTCAHNVYRKEISTQIDKNCIRFYPGLNGNVGTHEGYKVLEVYYPEQYKDINNQQEDYALLILDTIIGDYTGYFGIKLFDTEYLRNMTAYIWISESR